MGGEEGVKIIEKKVHEPKPLENSNMFTTFAEVVAELDSLSNYFGIIFSYMPANIEIISPTEMKIKNHEFTELANRLLSRLHEYDALTKRAISERGIVLEKLREVAPHLFKKEVEESKKAEETADKLEKAKAESAEKSSKPKKSKKSKKKEDKE